MIMPGTLAKGQVYSQTLVQEIMSTQFAYVEPDDTVEKSLALMTENDTLSPSRQGWSRGGHHFDRRPGQEDHRRPALSIDQLEMGRILQESAQTINTQRRLRCPTACIR